MNTTNLLAQSHHLLDAKATFVKNSLITATVLGFIGTTAQASLIEGFESGNLAAYTVIGGGPVVTTSAAHDGTYGLEVSNSAWLYRDDAGAQVSQGDTISFWVEFNRTADARAYFGFGASAAGTLSFVLAPNTGDIRFQENPAFDFTSLNTSSQSFLAGKWYRGEVVWGMGGSLTGNLYDSDGTTLLNTVSASSSLFTSGGIAFRGFGNVKSFDTIETTSAVPEPSTYIGAMMAAGLLALSARKNRK